MTAYRPEHKMLKYPRTPHLEGSRLQPGDEDLEQVRFSEIADKFIVVEEKCDGANSALSFDKDGSLLLQSRGHYLVGGAREKHFDVFKRWATTHQGAFYDVIRDRYVVYGEWVFAKHCLYYDALPHYFLEFDVFDRERGVFLDTASRRELLAGLPIVSVPVLRRGKFKKLADLTSLIGHSNFITDGHMERLAARAEADGIDVETTLFETDKSTTMEGLYLKIEENGEVVGRLKYVRRSFHQAVFDSGTHWLNRPIVPNELTYPVDAIFDAELPEGVATIEEV